MREQPKNGLISHIVFETVDNAYFSLMKVAFVHDWFTIPAGAEKVAKEIIDVIQPSSVFALFNFMDFGSLQHHSR